MRRASPSLLLTASCALLLGASVACGGDPGPGIPAPIDAVDPTLPSGQATSDPLLEVHVEGTGSVRSEPVGIDCPGRCAATFPAGTRVTLRAAPAEGWKVGAWGGACAGSKTCTVVAGEPVSVTVALALVDPRWDPSVGAADCADLWGVAGARLSACDAKKDRYVVVRKSKRNVALCERGALVKNIRAGLGAEPVGAKRRLGDGRTPEGIFYVPRRVERSEFYKALILSYPTPEDAKRGAAEGLVSQNELDRIESAHDACVEPPHTTGLGGLLELHGRGGHEDWTAGSVAVDDADMDLLFETLGVGDTIAILP